MGVDPAHRRAVSARRSCSSGHSSAPGPRMNSSRARSGVAVGSARTGATPAAEIAAAAIEASAARAARFLRAPSSCDLPRIGLVRAVTEASAPPRCRPACLRRRGLRSQPLARQFEPPLGEPPLVGGDALQRGRSVALQQRLPGGVEQRQLVGERLSILVGAERAAPARRGLRWRKTRRRGRGRARGWSFLVRDRIGRGASERGASAGTRLRPRIEVDVHARARSGVAIGPRRLAQRRRRRRERSSAAPPTPAVAHASAGRMNRASAGRASRRARAARPGLSARSWRPRSLGQLGTGRGRARLDEGGARRSGRPATRRRSARRRGRRAGP